ncbi:MBL fold metallo-hydrolase [Mucilaginibacter sp. UR6-1]|uniref:MBL fold metallo-hydrolase n=1 Tax=Mucilaginibacter sp. UR6-1 TaxID=1435643 RepID=UPI001E2A67A5|nr:MBL fold metallo-hydrolase [Mucilaginibacter sp. UR6-1]MCC8409699.1 MBL fold metallo-hydrolase [Mucilaginibacter sp. UR6-1]
MGIQPAKKQGKKFVNIIPTDAAGFGKMPSILREYINNKQENVPLKKLGPFTTDAGVYNTPPATGLRITWIGHSSIIIEIDGKRLLTDPVWSQRVSFSQSIGPKRFFDAPLALNQLPHIDAVISSHDHYDHLDEHTIKYLATKNIPFICSLGVGQYLRKWGVKTFTELNWGDSTQLDNLTITAAPARHFSGRGLFNRDETLWSSFVIKGPQHNIYFGADSGPSPSFKDIGDAFGPFDLTMLEVGAYGKHWPDIHMGPDNATNAHLALKGKIMLPIHWGTFNLAPHAWYEPAEKVLDFAAQKGISLFMPSPGTPTDVEANEVSNWWKPYMSI